MSILAILKPKSPSEKATRTVTDTIEVTPEIINAWASPPFQRPIRENEKVRVLAEKMKLDGGVWPGIVTLGKLGGITYLLDGQHRKHSFIISGLERGYTDIRICYYESMAEMGREYVELNSRLVNMRPDDLLRGMEGVLPILQHIRKKCPFVGYDFIRRNPRAPLLSMSVAIRCWRGSAGEKPVCGGASALVMAENLNDDDARMMTDYLNLALEGLGRDTEYQRLWSALNLTLSMWLYRHLVVSKFSAKTRQLSSTEFAKCLMALSADGKYINWLEGRALSDRDRSPAYARMRHIFAKRLEQDLGHKVQMPSPTWFVTGGHTV